MRNAVKDNIVISLSENFLKVVHTKGTGTSTKITQAVVKEMKDSNRESPKFIKSVLKGFNTKSTPTTLIVPATMLTTKTIEVQSVDAEEIDSIVNLQAGRHTPFSREEIQVGYINIGIYQNNFTKVLLVIANKNLLKNQVELFDKAGIKINTLAFAAEGMANFYANQCQIGSDAHPVGIIDIGAESTELIIVRFGMTLLSRNIPIGKSHMSSGDPGVIVNLVEELKKTVESYKNEDIDELPEKFTITTEDQMSQSLLTEISNALQWETQFHSYSNLLNGNKGAVQTLTKLAATTSVLDVISVAAHIDDLQVNLISKEMEIQKTMELQGRELFKSAILGISVLVFLATALYLQIHFKRAYLQSLRNDFQTERDQVEHLQKLSLSTAVVDDFLDLRETGIDTIKTIYELQPEDIYLQKILISDLGLVDITGISDVGELIYAFNSTLKESKTFANSEVKAQSAKRDRGKNVDSFEITLNIANYQPLIASGDRSVEEE